WHNNINATQKHALKYFNKIITELKLIYGQQSLNYFNKVITEQISILKKQELLDSSFRKPLFKVYSNEINTLYHKEEILNETQN
ncbi:32722_t:CDS:2, partial [Gigaspora margarita]